MNMIKIALIATSMLMASGCDQQEEERVFKDRNGKVLEGADARIAELEYQAEKNETNEDKIKERHRKRMKNRLVQKQRRGEPLTAEELRIIEEAENYLTPEERRKIRQQYRKDVAEDAKKALSTPNPPANSN